MVLGAILLGVVAGIIGFLPLRFALASSSKHGDTTMNLAIYALGSFVISLVIVAVLLFVCSRVAKGMVLPFGVSEILALIIVTCVYVLRRNRSHAKRNDDEEGRNA
ncbi:MAG: hypothetical protein ACOYIP_01895 [Coriobacteriales bacterium]|jgi:TctA family transporter